MVKKYIIEISGSGVEYGVGKITNEQYKYWERQEDDLASALNNKYNYKQNKTPESCILKNYYNDYQDIASYSGPLLEDATIKIFDETGQILLNTGPYKIAEKFENEDDFFDSGEEFHCWNNYDVSGYFIKWRLDGTGIYFRGEFRSNEFLIQKLKISIFDIDNDRIIDGVFYNAERVFDNGGEWSYSAEDFQVGFNETPK